MTMVDRHVYKIFQAPELDAAPVLVPTTIVFKDMGLRATSTLTVLFVDGDQLPNPDSPCPDQESHIILRGAHLEPLCGTRFIIGDVLFQGVEVGMVTVDSKDVDVLWAAVVSTGTVTAPNSEAQNQIQQGAELVPFNPAA